MVCLECAVVMVMVGANLQEMNRILSIVLKGLVSRAEIMFDSVQTEKGGIIAYQTHNNGKHISKFTS